jgi:photosystem II stability/assembly factor-like uncharacterized protein
MLRHSSTPILLFISVLPTSAAAQRWEIQRTGTTAEFRSLSVVDDRTVWAGGRNGVFATTADGGATWRVDTVPGASGLFFIGAHAVSATTAYLLGTSFVDGTSLARIYRTGDGGRSWREQYADSTRGVFFDGLAFWDADHGIAFGDPIGGSFVVITTADGGRSWERVAAERLPRPDSGEAAFAASGTAVVVRGSSHVWIGTGGGRSGRVLHSSDRGRSWSVVATPIAGGATAGIFTLAFTDERNGVALGGDYARRVGPSGSGYSRDGGASWVVIDTLSLNTVRFAPAPSWVGWAAGVDGRIARFVPPPARRARASGAPDASLEDPEVREQPPQKEEDQDGAEAPAAELLRSVSRHQTSEQLAHPRSPR